ncbi:hypothetical protein AB4341_16590 [Vibrio breoganii]
MSKNNATKDIRYKIGDLVLNNYRHPLGAIKIVMGLIRLRKRYLQNISHRVEKINFTRLDEILDNLQAESIIYANISLNVIDGSSIWLTSISNVISSHRKTILISHKNIVNDLLISNINNENVVIIQPSDLGLDVISTDDAYQIAKAIDRNQPNISDVFIRGLNTAKVFSSDRHFHKRLNVYLTDFYNKCGTVPEDNKLAIYNVSVNAKAILYQTEAIKNKLLKYAKSGIEYLYTPPILPSSVSLVGHEKITNDTISIIYAGKVNEDWGVLELIEWVAKEGLNVKVKIISNKLTGKLNGISSRHVIEKLAKKGIIDFVDGLNRSEVIHELSKADFVWCYRPERLEANTLELSTKLLEAVAVNGRAICFPNSVNTSLLGNDYPYFIRNKSDLGAVLAHRCDDKITERSQKIIDEHSFEKASRRFSSLFSEMNDNAGPNILFAGHDMKFVDAYISNLSSRGYNIKSDQWNWGTAVSIDSSKKLLDWADIIFCEWGLANSVWYSNNIRKDQKLIIRIHLQEINERARKFSQKVNINNVHKVIFVSERVRKEALRLWNWPENKTATISNYVLDCDFNFGNIPEPLAYNTITDTVNLGMVGIVPTRKRFDRSITLLKSLISEGIDAKLYIKGHRPEELEFMKSGSRAVELDYYYDQYARIENLGLKDRVIFEGWGNDVALWYNKIDFILSPSDFESFHYALADGVLSGSFPLIWPWEESEMLYPKEWVVNDTKHALEVVKKRSIALDTARVKLNNRNEVIKRYGYEKVFNELNEILIEC